MKLTPKMIELVDKVLVDMEKNEKMPWDMPWFTTNLFNWKSQKPYRGMNIISLSLGLGNSGMKGQFLTFNQARAEKATVKKGSHGIPIAFFSMVEKKTVNEKGEKDKFPCMRTFTVFSVDQIEGIKPRETKERELTPNQLGDLIIKKSGAKIIESEISQAFYRPSDDTVNVPHRKLWKTDEGFYSTMFHELGHWTAKADRADRPNDYQNQEGRAFEELVAELTGSFLASFIGYHYDTQHSSYIKSWVSMFKDKKETLYSASSKAQKAVDYLLGNAGLLTVAEEQA